MIINTRSDLEKASPEVRETFLRILSAGVKRWVWEDGEWRLKTYTKALEKFGLSINDIPAPKEPAKPGYNPKDRAQEQLAAEVRDQRDRLLAKSDYAVQPDYPLSDSERDAVIEYRQALRDIPEQKGFPDSIDWPGKPGPLQ